MRRHCGFGAPVCICMCIYMYARTFEDGFPLLEQVEDVGLLIANLLLAAFFIHVEDGRAWRIVLIRDWELEGFLPMSESVCYWHVQTH